MARDVWMVDQRGCLSPVALYVQKKGEVSPKEFAGLVVEALQKLYKKDNIAPRRDIASFAASQSLQNRLVIQNIVIKGFNHPPPVFSALRPIQKYLQCVALECHPKKRKTIAEQLSQLGVNRICRAGTMQIPPVTWHHDGKPNLASWIHWADLEE